MTKLANASIRESAHITAALEGMFPGKAVSFLPFFTVITSSRFFRETKVHSQLDGQPETVKGISLIIIICNNIVIFFKEAVIAVMALIRLSTTTHNLLTFNISEITSNNSEKLSLLPDKNL